MRFLLLVLIFSLPYFTVAQTYPCRVALKADRAADKLKLFYTGGVLADSIHIDDVSRLSRGAIDSMVSTIPEGYYTTFHRLIAIDSSYIQTPSASLYYHDSLVCSVPAQWHWVDTVKGVKSETNLSKLPKEPNKPNFSEFKWSKGAQPVVVVDLPKTANIGDVITVVIDTNYPINEVTSRLQSPTLAFEKVVSTSSNISITNNIATHKYSTTLTYKVVKPGTVAFEAMKFKVAGKKARMSEIPLNIEQ